MIDRKLSVVIPVYNEHNMVIKMLEECVSSLNGLKYEIILVDDGSLDGTYAKAQEFANRHSNIKIVNYKDNHGKGFAVRYGFKFTTGDLVAFIDGDLNIHPSQILTLIDYMNKEDADIVVCSKRHELSKINYPTNRKILSDIYYLFVRTLFGIPVKDTQVGLKLYKREVLKDVCPVVLVKRYAFDIEILANAHRLGYKIVESPVEIYMKYSSHVNKKEVLNMFIDTCAIFYRMKIIHYYDKKLENAGKNNDLVREEKGLEVMLTNS